MRTLVADDDPVLRRLVTGLLTSWGHEVESAGDGDEAWQVLAGEDPPPIAILDWIMPGPTGVEICRRLRESTSGALVYVLLLTSRGNTDDIVTALASGADDYVTKPFEPAELRARLQVGERVIGLQRKLADRVMALEHALAHVTRLQGLLPICMYCKKIRDDQNYWQQVELYIGDHSGATFSHGICPECMELHVRPQLDRLRRPQAT